MASRTATGPLRRSALTLRRRPFGAAPAPKRPRAKSAPSRRALYSRGAIYSRILLRAIKTELGEMEYFTREDLLHLACLQHVSTIYRYHLVCTAVRDLLLNQQLVAHNRTDLTLPGRQLSREEPLHEQYLKTVETLVKALPNGTTLDVMDVVASWQSDRNLTENAKRTVVRRVMPHLAKAGLVTANDDLQYVVR